MSKTKHYTIRRRYDLRYLCNQAVSITLDKVAKDLSEVNCKNCLLVLKNPKTNYKDIGWLE